MELNWSLCTICQRPTGECLKYPFDNPVSSTNTTGPYQVFLDTVAYLRTIDSLPVILRFSSEDAAENFARHNAGWHKNCETNLVSLKCKETCLHPVIEKENYQRLRTREDFANANVSMQKSAYFANRFSQSKLLNKIQT